MQESQHWMIERSKGTEAIPVSELCAAMQMMPNGFGVTGIANREDGITIVQVRAVARKPVALPK